VYNPDGTFSLICRQEGDEVREMYLSTGKPAIAPQDHLLKKFPIGYHSTGVFCVMVLWILIDLYFPSAVVDKH
jgi:hypothetical protein